MRNSHGIMYLDAIMSPDLWVVDCYMEQTPSMNEENYD